VVVDDGLVTVADVTSATSFALCSFTLGIIDLAGHAAFSFKAS
jgi:hypothetical protein